MEKAARAMFVKDYVRYQLTGVWTTDHVEAQGSLLFDNINWCWSEDLCRMSGIPISILPPLVKPTDISGHITAEASAITGIRAGTPVINGATDTALEALRRRDSRKLLRHEAGDLRHDLSLPQGGASRSQSADLFARSRRSVVHVPGDLVCRREPALVPRHVLQGGIRAGASGRQNTYRTLDEEAEKVPAGCEGLFFHPYLMGERSPYWDTKLRASFIGATAHHGAATSTAAVLEGVAFSIKDNFSLIENTVPIHEVRIVGGGGKSPLWRSIIANVLNRPILKYANDDSSYGSALLAGVGAGIFSSHEEAVEKGLHLKERVEPDAETAAKYQEIFERYRELHDALAPLYHKF